MSDLAWSTDGADWPNRGASSFVEAAGLRWHVQRMGEGPPLLLIHGTGAATHSWRGLMPLLAEHFAVIAFDLPGHGFTQTPSPHRLSLPGMAADIAVLLRKLDVQPDVVVGHSAGAAILARMCLDRTIDPRVLVGINAALMPFGGVANALFSPMAKLLTMNALVPRLFAWQAGHAGAVERLIGYTGSTIDAAGIAQYRKLVRSPAHVSAALRMMANWDLAPLLRDLPSLRQKLLLITAENDRAIAPREAAQVKRIQPRAEIAYLEGLGHLAHEEAPQQIAALITEHAAREHALRP